MSWRTYWLLLGAAAWGGVVAAQAPASPPPGSTNSTAAAGEPDAELIEFLGADDHGDTVWWDMLRHTASTPAPPPATRGAPEPAQPNPSPATSSPER